MQTILATPCGTARTSDGLGVSVSLAESTRALSGRGKSTQLTVLVHGVADPVDLWIATDSVMVGIDADYFVVFVGSILGNPV